MEDLTPAQVEAARSAGASDSDLLKIAELRQRAREFEDKRQRLVEIGPVVARTNDYDLMVEYGRLLNRADTIKAKVQRATEAIDNAVRWARSAVGLDGMRNLSSLGVAWFLPLAVISAALSVLGYWISDYQKFTRRFAEVQAVAERLKAEGMDPAEAERQAAGIVADASGGWLRDAGKVAAAAVAVVLGVAIWRGMRSR